MSLSWSCLQSGHHSPVLSPNRSKCSVADCVSTVSGSKVAPSSTCLCTSMSICEYILIVLSKCTYPQCHHLCHFETAFCKIGTEPLARVKASRGQCMWQPGSALKAMISRCLRIKKALTRMQVQDHLKIWILFFVWVRWRHQQGFAEYHKTQMVPRSASTFCEGICKRRASSTPTPKSRDTITKRGGVLIDWGLCWCSLIFLGMWIS